MIPAHGRVIASIPGDGANVPPEIMALWVPGKVMRLERPCQARAPPKRRAKARMGTNRMTKRYPLFADQIAEGAFPFGPLLIWHTARPGSRILRAARTAAFKAAGRIAYPVKVKTPAWWTLAKQVARNLAKTVQGACMALRSEIRVATSSACSNPIGFNHEADIRHHEEKARQPHQRLILNSHRNAERIRKLDDVCRIEGISGSARRGDMDVRADDNF